MLLIWIQVPILHQAPSPSGRPAPYPRGAACAGQLGLPDLGWGQAQAQAQARGVEIRRRVIQGKWREMRGGNRGDHAALPTRCASDRGKEGPQWAWGRVGDFDPGFALGLGLWCSGSGRIRVEARAAGCLEHLDSSADQDQNSRAVQKSRKQARRRWLLWRHYGKFEGPLSAKKINKRVMYIVPEKGT